jgi:hypothetical protein
VAGGFIYVDTISTRFNVNAHNDISGKPTPESFGQILMSGSSPSPSILTKVDIRLRDPNKIVTNPTSVGDTLIIDLPKSDYQLLQALIDEVMASTKTAGKKKKKLVLQYGATSGTNQYLVSFSIQ